MKQNVISDTSGEARNSQLGVGFGGVSQQSPQLPEASGFSSAKFFQQNNAFLSIFCRNSYYTAITPQLKAFEMQSKRTK